MSILEAVRYALNRDGTVRRSDIEWMVSEIEKLTYSLKYLEERCDKMTEALQSSVVLLGGDPANLDFVQQVKRELLGGGEGEDLDVLNVEDSE